MRCPGELHLPLEGKRCGTGGGGRGNWAETYGRVRSKKEQGPSYKGIGDSLIRKKKKKEREKSLSL